MYQKKKMIVFFNLLRYLYKKVKTTITVLSNIFFIFEICIIVSYVKCIGI